MLIDSADERLREITCRSDINQILVAIFVIGATHQWTSKSVGFDGLDVVPGEEQVVQLRRQGQWTGSELGDSVVPQINDFQFGKSLSEFGKFRQLIAMKLEFDERIFETDYELRGRVVQNVGASDEQRLQVWCFGRLVPTGHLLAMVEPQESETGQIRHQL